MKKFLPLTIVLIIGFLVWTLLGFPQDLDLVSTKILSTLTLLGTIFTVAKGIKEVFFDKPSKTSDKGTDSENPLIVQIADSKKEPSLLETRSDSLKRIRSLTSTFTREQIVDDITKVLGDKTDLFWKEIDSNPKGIPFSLAENGFWLEGLLIVFEQNNWSIPKNDGRTLKQVLVNQWTAEKLGIHWSVSLDVIYRHLGRLAHQHYPQMKYPISYSGRIRSPYSSYERLVKSIGTEAPPERLRFSRILLNLFLAPFSLLKVLITLPFTGMERKIGYYIATHRGSSAFHHRLESIWYKYEKFKLRAWRFFDLFNIQIIRNTRRGRSIIESAEATGILGTDGEHIWLTDEYWRDYFTILQVINTNSLDDFLKEYVNNRYRRRYPSQGDRIAIMACGLSKAPADAVELVFQRDPIAASKCLLTLDDIPSNTQESLKERMLASIVENLKSVPSDGNTSFCLASIRAMRSLSDNPYYANIALEKIPEIYHYERRPDAARLVASFGPPVFDLLKEKLTTDDPSFLRNILIALGELRDKRAIPLIKKVSDEATEVRVKIMSAVVLANYFNDKDGITALEKYLRFEDIDTKKHFPWTDFDISGENAIAFGLDALVRASVPPGDEHSNDPWTGMTSPFLKALTRHKHNPKIEVMLLDVLEHSEQHRLTIFLIEALGIIKSQKAIPKLKGFLRSENDYVRDLAMNSLRQIDGTILCSELTGLLYADELYLVKEALDGLGALSCLDAIPKLIKTLNNEEIEILYPNDEGYPIALYAVEALIKIGRNIRKEQSSSSHRISAGERCLKTAADWCNAQLGDKRPLRPNHKNVTYQSLFLLNFKIRTKDSYKYYSDWVEEHPEDLIA
jgi:HEAT repeat protein